MHFHSSIHHKLAFYNGIYTNNMVVDAYAEYKKLEEKEAARKVMLENLTSGFKDMFAKQLDIAKLGRSSMLMSGK